MKKNKIFIGIAVVAIAAVATWNASMSTRSSELSDLQLANVEALASMGYCPNGCVDCSNIYMITPCRCNGTYWEYCEHVSRFDPPKPIQTAVLDPNR